MAGCKASSTFRDDRDDRRGYLSAGAAIAAQLTFAWKPMPTMHPTPTFVFTTNALMSLKPAVNAPSKQNTAIAAVHQLGVPNVVVVEAIHPERHQGPAERPASLRTTMECAIEGEVPQVAYEREALLEFVVADVGAFYHVVDIVRQGFRTHVRLGA